MLNDTEEVIEQKIIKYDVILVASPNNLKHIFNRNTIAKKDVEDAIKNLNNVAKKLNKKVIAVSDAYYMNPTDKIAHNVYVYSKKPGGKNHRLYSYSESNEVMPDLHLRTTEEMIEEFSFLNNDELVKEIVVDNSIEFSNSLDDGIMPTPGNKPFFPHIENEVQLSRDLINSTLKNKYGDNPPQFILNSLQKEFDIIDAKSF
jgi:DNA polymerase-3 subunit alpha (Gram-positive type)